MKNRKILAFVAVIVFLAAGSWAAGYAYRDLCHTYIAFAGGSITFQGAGKEGYIGIVRNDFYKRGRGDIKTLYFGVNGERSTDLLAALDTILAARTRVLVILVGANDALGYYSLDSAGNSIETYEMTLRTILRKAKKRGAQVIMCSPVIVGERDYFKPAPDAASDASTKLLKQPRRPGFDPAKADAEVGRYVEKAREVAAEEGVAFCDLRKAFKDYLAAHNPENRLEGILTLDGLHPNARGHALIAETMLPYLQDNKAIKKEPVLRRILRPFTNRKNPFLWKALSRFDKSIK